MAITSYNSITGEIVDEEPAQALESQSENIFGNNWKKNIYGNSSVFVINFYLFFFTPTTTTLNKTFLN